MMQLGRLYLDTVQKLLKAGIDDARVDAVHLFEFCLGVTGSQLVLHPEREVDERLAALLEETVNRRLAREPLQYIIGTREFWSLEFYVSPAVLIPRPETEFLLDRVLGLLRGSGFTDLPLLDMCTGSGVIAVVLAMETGSRKIVAADHSIAALETAARNIARHEQAGSISLVCSDLFGGFRPGCRFASIVANPPYIAVEDYASLQPEVRDWEPQSALLAGEGGLDVIKRLAAKGHHYLMPGGWMFIEIGAGQKDEVYTFFTGETETVYDRVEVLSDWAGKPRVLQARKKAE
jgi:release factor glutamine methyltransferase